METSEGPAGFAMSATLQLILVGALVAVAAGYLLRATYRTWFGAKSGCGSGCGKCATPSANEPEVKGRRPLPMA